MKSGLELRPHDNDPLPDLGRSIVGGVQELDLDLIPERFKKGKDLPQKSSFLHRKKSFYIFKKEKPRVELFQDPVIFPEKPAPGIFARSFPDRRVGLAWRPPDNDIDPARTDIQILLDLPRFKFSDILDIDLHGGMIQGISAGHIGKDLIGRHDLKPVVPGKAVT